MKFRMPENSLFALLLRSPWWISFAIAAVIALGALAVLPRHLAPYGAAGVLPFVVIGVLALVRELRLPSTSQVTRTLETLRAMSARDFTALLEQAYHQRGYTVKRLSQQTGADLQLVRGHERAVVACKRWKAASHGVEALRELQSAAAANDGGQCFYVALGTLSEAARKHAREHRIVLVQGTDLVQLVAPALPR